MMGSYMRQRFSLSARFSARSHARLWTDMVPLGGHDSERLVVPYKRAVAADCIGKALVVGVRCAKVHREIAAMMSSAKPARGAISMTSVTTSAMR